MEFDDDARDKASSDEGVSTGLDFVTDVRNDGDVLLQRVLRKLTSYFRPSVTLKSSSRGTTTTTPGRR